METLTHKSELDPKAVELRDRLRDLQERANSNHDHQEYVRTTRNCGSFLLHCSGMRIGIDARLYGVSSGTGIGRYVEELIRYLVDHELLEGTPAELFENACELLASGFSMPAMVTTTPTVR